MKLKNVIIIIVLIVGLLGLKYIFFPSGSGKKNVPQNSKPTLKNVTAYIVKPEKMINEITASGTIKANEEVQLQTELAGKITELNFKEGSKVTKGQLLIKINDADLQAQYKKLKLQYALADERMQRQEQLLAIKGISQEDFDIAQNQHNTIKADMDFATAQIAKTEIRAPFNGVIGLKSISEGAYVTPNTIIANIQQIDPVKIDFSVPERYASLVKQNDTVIFTIDGNKEKHIGKVFAIDPKIDITNRTLQIRAICPNSKNDIFPGAFARVQLVLSDVNNAIMIPTEAIIPDIKGEKVYYLKNGRAEFVIVETGLRTASTIQITKGLAIGDTVITTGIMQLKPGALVNITDLK